MTGTGYQDDPRPPIRRRNRGSFYPPHGTHPRRGDRLFRSPPNRGRILREVYPESFRGDSRGAYRRSVR